MSEKPRPLVSSGQRMAILAFGGLMLLMVIIIVVRSMAEPELPSDAADPANPEQVAAGKLLYDTRCAGCHGGTLEGQAGWPERLEGGVLRAAPLSGGSPVTQQNDRWIFDVIHNGGQATAPADAVSAMPPFGNTLSDAEIWALVSYIKSTWPSSPNPLLH